MGLRLVGGTTSRKSTEKEKKEHQRIVNANVSTKDSPAIKVGGSSKKKKTLLGTAKKAFKGNLISDEQAKGGNILGDIALSVTPAGKATGAAKTLAKTAGSKRAAFVELANAFPKIVKQSIKDPKGAIKEATAVITRTKTLLTSGIRATGAKGKSIEHIPKGTSITTQRAFVGKNGVSPVDKLFNLPAKTRELAKRYATNQKTIGQSGLMLAKRGLGGATVAFIVGAFGTYPFSAWARQEVLSSLKISARDARERGDFETAEEMIKMREEVHEVTWEDFIPYANVIEKFKEFTKADILSVESEKKLLAQSRGKVEFEGQSTSEEIEERDIQQKAEQDARDLKFQQDEEARIKRQDERDEEFEEAEEERNKRQDERDAQFKIDQEARDKEFEDRAKAEEEKFAKLKKESEAKELENTKFFDAIRKRNAGQKLTPEEIALLEKRGASSKSTSTYKRKSLVQF